MCFSPTASFVAGAMLVSAGTYTAKQSKSHKDLPFSLIPIFFGIQQIAEGFVWLSLQSHAWDFIHTFAIYSFGFFAYIWWPIFIPFAVYVLEPSLTRRKIIGLLAIMGSLVSIFLMYFIIHFGLEAKIIDHSIVYSFSSPDFNLGILFYLGATCFACLFSSHTFIRLFGTIALILASITALIYQYSFDSVWCFFAAILSSLIILYYLRQSSSEYIFKTT